MTDGKITCRPSDRCIVLNPDGLHRGGEADIRGNIMMGDGAYKTTDAGKT